MFHNLLKSGLRINRTLGFSCLLVAAVLFFKGMPDWFASLRWVALVALSIFGVLVNEAALKLIKRYPQTDPLFLEKFSLMAPVVSMGVVLVAYGLSGVTAIGLLGMTVVMQCFLFGHARMGKVGFVILLAVYALALSLGYQVPFLGTPVDSFLNLVPFLVSMAQMGHQIAIMVKSSNSQLSRLQSLAATDGLTGLINRRQFNHQLQSEIARAKRHHLPLSLALFDIDDFKKLNDQYGHPMGDRVLKELGRLVIQNIRECDISARYGGEEFALILPETRLVEAYDILERLRALVARTVFCLPDNPITTSISVGVAQLDFDHPTAVALVEKADAALYDAKRKGKNQVVYGTVPTPKISLSRAPKPTPRP